MKLTPNISQNSHITKFIAVTSIAMLLPLFTGCDQKKESPSQTTVTHKKTSQTPFTESFPSQETPLVAENKMVVTSVINAGQYLYIEGEVNGVKKWIAANQLTVKPGDTVQYESGQVMSNFFSKTLDRTFEEVIFTNLAMVINSDGTVASSSMPKAAIGSKPENPHKNGLPTTLPDTTISVEKVKGGYTVEELYAKKDELNGQIVKVRGKVVKFLPGIMKRNWIHLQDGTGSTETNDLTITTQELVNNGDTIICAGKLVVNKDFGQGYAYSLIMEEATITKE